MNKDIANYDSIKVARLAFCQFGKGKDVIPNHVWVPYSEMTCTLRFGTYTYTCHVQSFARLQIGNNASAYGFAETPVPAGVQTCGAGQGKHHSLVKTLRSYRQNPRRRPPTLRAVLQPTPTSLSEIPVTRCLNLAADVDIQAPRGTFYGPYLSRANC